MNIPSHHLWKLWPGLLGKAPFLEKYRFPSGQSRFCLATLRRQRRRLRGLAPRFCLSGPRKYKEESRSPKLKLRAGQEIEQETVWEQHSRGTCVMEIIGAPGLWEAGEGGGGGPMQRQKGVNTHGLRQELKAIRCGCLWCLRWWCCRWAGGLARPAKGAGFYPEAEESH